MNELAWNGVAEFKYGERTIGYVVLPGRCSRVTIRIRGSDEVEVRVPPRVLPAAVHACVVEQAEWIVQVLARQAKKPRLTPLQYVTGATVFVLGAPCRLEVTRSVWKGVSRENDVLRVTLYNHSDMARIQTLVETWFQQQAREVLPVCLQNALANFGGLLRSAAFPLVMRSAHQPDGVYLTVRPMKTRWGSCSKDGHVTLSTELFHMPHRLIEYVIVHELCHLVHLNHSPAFYFQVARCLPDWRQRRRELETRSWLRAQVVL